MSVSFAFTTKTKPPSFLQKTVKCSSVAQDDGVGGTLEGQGRLQKGANQLASRETQDRTDSNYLLGASFRNKEVSTLQQRWD